MNSAIERIISIERYGDSKNPLKRVSPDQMQRIDKETSDCPRKFTMLNNESDNYTIELDVDLEHAYNSVSYPNNRLKISYYPRYRVFDSNYANYDEFDGYDETESDFGGEWKIPSNFHRYIVDLAIAKIFDDAGKIEKLENEVRELALKQETFIDLNSNTGYLGVDNCVNRR